MLDGNQTSIALLKKAFSDDAAPDELDFASLIKTFVIRRNLEIEAEELIKELKELFSTGKCPSGADFAKLIDSFIPKTSTDFLSFEDILPHVANLHEALEGINDRKLISALRLAQVLDQKKNYVHTHSIKNSAITSEKILNENITSEKIADQSITSTKLSATDLILPETTRAKTQALFDDTEAVATTAFVQNAIRNLNEFPELITLDKNNGHSITSVATETNCYIGNNQIVYSNRDDDNKLYLKSATAMENGTVITNIFGIFPCYISNDQIVYTNGGDGKLYLKSARGTDIGQAITSVEGAAPCYIGNDQIVYMKNYRLYLKSISDSDNGKAITSQWSAYPCYIGNGQILYLDNNLGLYLKSATENDNGKKICEVLPVSGGYFSVFPFCYVGNNQIVYTNTLDDGKLYIKSATGSDLGTAITNAVGLYPCYVGNGKIVYTNVEDNFCLYVKNIFADSTYKKDFENPEENKKKKLSAEEKQNFLTEAQQKFLIKDPSKSSLLKQFKRWFLVFKI